jgi:site-specific recombinase XerD
MARARREQIKSDDMKTKRFFEDKLIEWVRHLRDQGLKPNSQMGYSTSVRSFFSHHYMKLIYRQGMLKFEANPEVKATMKPDFVPNNVHVRALFNTAPHNRDKLLILILSTTGASPQDVCDLRIQAFRGLYIENGEVSAEPAYTVKPRRKSSVDQYILLNREVMFFLASYLRERGNPKTGYLLVTRKGNAYSPRVIWERLKPIAEKALGPELGKEFQPKSLRAYFRNAMLLAEIPEDVHDALLGWQRKGSSQHYPISEEVIRNAYDKIMPQVSIDGGQIEKEQLKEIEAQVGRVALDFQEKIAKLEEEKEALACRLHILESRMGFFVGDHPQGKIWFHKMRPHFRDQILTDAESDISRLEVYDIQLDQLTPEERVRVTRLMAKRNAENNEQLPAR